MGTAQLVFAEVVLPEVTWPEVALTGSDSRALTWSMFCACATGSCAISTLAGPRKWRQSRDRKRPCAEVCAGATGSCATVSRVFSHCSTSTISRVFFLVVIPWLPKVTRRGGWGVRNRRLCNRKLATGSEGFPPFSRVVVGVFSTTSASNPGSLPLSRHFPV